MLALADHEISRFPSKEHACMPGSSTTPGRPSACDVALEHVAFRYTDSVSTRNQFSIAAQWLACTSPCRRFADILADAYARLGVDAVRYSFIVVDLHHLLLAGLPAHLCENSNVELARRKFVSITMNRKRTALAVAVERGKGRKQFCAFSARARFHTGWTQTRHRPSSIILALCRSFWNAPIDRVCVENPLIIVTRKSASQGADGSPRPASSS
jgi:hypothetical protein